MYEIPLYKPSLDGNEKKYVNECLDSTWISSKGEFIPRFENRFAEHVGCRYAASVCNGTVALHVALLALGIGIGDEVIVPTLTYVASVNSIAYTGARPVFVDSLKTTWQMDPEDVRRKISPKTRAIMAVHLYGFPCDMERLVSLAEEHGLLLIEDCAEAIGSLCQGRHVGSFGKVSTYSFYGNKTIIARYTWDKDKNSWVPKDRYIYYSGHRGEREATGPNHHGGAGAGAGLLRLRQIRPVGHA